MKTKKELKDLMIQADDLDSRLRELTVDELRQVSGGVIRPLVVRGKNSKDELYVCICGVSFDNYRSYINHVQHCDDWN